MMIFAEHHITTVVYSYETIYEISGTNNLVSSRKVAYGRPFIETFEDLFWDGTHIIYIAVYLLLRTVLTWASALSKVLATWQHAARLMVSGRHCHRHNIILPSNRIAPSSRTSVNTSLDRIS